METIYLDHNATTPLRPEVLTSMLPYLGEHYGNPSSAHALGRAVAPALNEARAKVAALVSAAPEEITFTSCGTEGDNMALRSVVAARKGKPCHIITSIVEHPAVYNTCRALEAQGLATATYLGVDRYGMVDPEDLKRALKKETALVSLMLAHNETGTLNPLAEIARFAHEHGALLHTDAVQAIGKVPVDVQALGVDMLTASAHKFNAPKGVGFQYVRKGLTLPPFITGGGQEQGQRAGTENLASIVGMGEAARLAREGLTDGYMDKIRALRERLEEGLLRSVPDTILNSHPVHRVPNTLSLSFKYIEGEALMVYLDAQGLCVSTGSACSTGSHGPSRIMGALGLDAVCSRGTLRLSLGYGNTMEQIDRCLEILVPLALKLQSMSPLKTKG